MSETKQPLFNLTIVNPEEEQVYKVFGISEERRKVIIKKMAEATSQYYMGNGKRSQMLNSLTEIAENTNELVFIMFSAGTATKDFERIINSPMGGLVELLSMIKSKKESE